MLLCERPSTTDQMGMLAQKDGTYTRPIVGSIIDLRTEDFLPTKSLQHILSHRMIGELPEIPGINQVGLFIVIEFNHVVTSQAVEEQIIPLLASGAYCLLPGSKLKSNLDNKYIQKCQEDADDIERSTGKWWEYTAVFDADGQFIKAPKIPRAGEPDAEQIDERIDDYEENINRYDVTSPYVLERRRAKPDRLRPSLSDRLANI